jgi:hypothetical protein
VLEVCRLDWKIVPLRGGRFIDNWEPAVERCTAYGAKAWFFTRSEADSQWYEQVMVWERRADFERYWYSLEIEKARESIINWYDVPLIPSWHTLLSAHSIAITADTAPSHA